MQKSELVEAFQKRLAEQDISLSEAQTKLVVEELFDLIADTLESGERVQVRGFGTFEVRERSGRTGVNPQTREPMPIPPSRNVGFTVATVVRERVRASLD